MGWVFKVLLFFNGFFWSLCNANLFNVTKWLNQYMTSIKLESAEKKENYGIGPFPFFQWYFLNNLLSSRCAKRKTMGCSGYYQQMIRKLPTNDEETTNKWIGVNQHKRMHLLVW